MNELSDEQLNLRAAGVTFAIFTISDMITQDILTKIDKLKNLDDKDKGKVSFIVSYVTLFNAQRFFWENVIKDKQNAVRFEYYLYNLFEKIWKFDPRPYIKDLTEYIREGEPSREVQYIGSKICKELNKEDAFLMLEITTRYHSFFIHGATESLKRAWEISESELKKILERIEKQ